MSGLNRMIGRFGHRLVLLPKRLCAAQCILQLVAGSSVWIVADLSPVLQYLGGMALCPILKSQWIAQTAFE